MHPVWNCIGNWMLYLAALSGIAAFAYNYTGWFAFWLLLCVLCLPLLSLLLTLPTALTVRIRLSCPDTAERGETVFLLLQAEGARFLCPFPVCVELLQESVSAAYPKVRRVRSRMLPGISPKKGTKPAEKTRNTDDRKGKNRFRLFGGEGDRKLSGARVTVDTGHTGIVRTTLSRAVVTDFFGLFLFRVRIVGNRSCDTLIVPGKTVLTGIPDPWKRNGSVTVPAQGFAEQQEIRSYRPGDPMRSVHWKLSAKTDSVLVREGVEPERKRLGLTFDRTPDPTAADEIYDCMDALARTLLADMRTAYIRAAWRCADGTTDSYLLRRQEELPDLYRRLFSGRTPREYLTDTDIIHDAALKDADAGYHITAAPDGVRIALTLTRSAGPGMETNTGEMGFPPQDSATV